MCRLACLIGFSLALITAPAVAREVNVAIGLSLSPYVIPEETRGMEYDIVKEALALEGHTLRPHYMPQGRVAKELGGGQLEAALTQRMEVGLPAHYSDVYITYQNFAITLASRNLAVDKEEDLAGKSIIAFQRAALYLGPRFKAVVEANPLYREESRQVVQPIMLYLDRIDVVIADRNIFNWFAHQPEVAAKVDTRQPLRFHPLFPPTDYRMAFRDEGLRDAFNRGLAKLRASGAYDRIVRAYTPVMAAEAR
ncbi:substrate-binding periplasmic protein [Paramagnetospirillum marisnigri]|nr:transporter substrate-binding domain-containing protein [Paramagnetospirillum marisnigri]